MFCHNAYPEMAEGSDRSGSEAVFSRKIPEGIDCQRCHGPGGQHVRAAQSGKANIDAIRGAIVNPARLTRDRQLEVCMQCHLESTSTRLPYALRRFNRGVFSFRPGKELADYMIHFDHAPGTGHDDKFEIVNQAYRLRKSYCFQKSGGLMTCATCHDPHNTLRGEEATRHYVSVCQSCHQTLSKNHTTSRECLSCHMPKRRTDDVVHVVMTDHYIQRRKPSRDLLAPLAEQHDENAYRGEVVLYYPPDLPRTPDNELYLPLAQVKQNSNLKDGIPRLKAAIDQAQPQHAADLLEKTGARSTDATVLSDLALVYRQLGKLNEAIATLRKALFWIPIFRRPTTISAACYARPATQPPPSAPFMKPFARNPISQPRTRTSGIF